MTTTSIHQERKPAQVGIRLADVYHNSNSQKQTDNAIMFVGICDRFPWMGFHQPNKAQSPWLWRELVRWEDGPAIVIDFWPHKGKAQRDGSSVVVGVSAIRQVIAKAIDDSPDHTVDEFDVIEDAK